MDRLVRAKVLLAEAESLGLTLDDLTQVASLGASAPVARLVPTVAEYVDVISPTFSKGTLRTYRSYWRLAVELIGDRPLDSVTTDDCAAVVTEAGRRGQARRPGSDGRSPRETCVAALRALFNRAERARLVLHNPALGVDKPRRLPNRRRALTDSELDEVIDAVHATSRDIELDLLLIRTHLESGARQEGAVGLVFDGLDHRRATLWLKEKFGVEREQPVSGSLVRDLDRFARSRGATRGSDAVFRTARGKPISRRRYDTLFGKVQGVLTWTKRTPVTAHVLRHTAGTAIERIAGEAVAEAFLGHNPSTVTGLYTKAPIAEVAAAVSALTGEPHPLAPGTEAGR